MTSKDRKTNALDCLFDAVNDCLMNEGVTIDEFTEFIQEKLKFYKDLGKRLTPTKRRMI
jgi:hypothetical protein